jgi:Enolase, C-terminal TIM barrel domain
MITNGLLAVSGPSLIKLNQIGTVTETLEAMAICRQAGYRQFLLAPLRGDRGHVHRRPGRRHRLRSPEVRRSRPRRAGRQV